MNSYIQKLLTFFIDFSNELLSDNKILEINKKQISIDYLSEGQAMTCLLAKKYLNPDDFLTIGACDNKMEFDLLQEVSKNCLKKMPKNPFSSV